MNKRTFLGICASFAAFCLLVPSHTVRSIFNRLKSRRPSDLELETMSCIADILYPPDAGEGAAGLGIATFLANQAHTPYFRQYLAPLRRVIACLDVESHKINSKSYCSQTSDVRVRLLDDLMSGRAEAGHPGIQRDIFSLYDLVIEGCFSDPSHGGNRHKKAWGMLNGTFKEEWFNA
jgi:hypothetical protein